MENEKKAVPPLAVIIECASNEMGAAVTSIGRKYGLPSSLLDVALTNVTAQVKEMKSAEFAQNAYEAYEEGDVDG